MTTGDRDPRTGRPRAGGRDAARKSYEAGWAAYDAGLNAPPGGRRRGAGTG